MQSFLTRLMPFLFLGILLVLVVAGFILFSYLLIFGALVGLVLFVLAWVRGLFFNNTKKQLPKQQRRGRTINHDDL